MNRLARAQATCGVCGLPVDAWRAPAARLLPSGLVVFCSTEHREAYHVGAPLLVNAAQLTPARSTPAAETASTASLEPERSAATFGPAAPRLEELAPGSQLPSTQSRNATPHLGSSRVDAARAFLPTLGFFPIGLRAIPTLAAFLALAWSFSQDRTIDRAAALVSVLAPLLTIAAARLERSWLTTQSPNTAPLALSLTEAAARIDPAGRIERVRGDALRSGEEVVVGAGERLPVDAIVSEGSALVALFPLARPERASAGRELPTGALILEGEIRAIATRTKADRTWSPLAAEAAVEAASPAVLIARAGRLVLMGVATLGLVLRASSDSGSLTTALVEYSLSMLIVSQPSFERLLASFVRRHVLALAEVGVMVSPKALAAAGRVSTVVLAARGTVLSGQPTLSNVEALRDTSNERLLSLAAGALAPVDHALAAAILRGAVERKVGPDLSRSHDVVSGLGVVCTSSDGHTVAVGARELVMREGVSVAIAEESLRALEQRGQTALLVAVDGRLAGLLTLEDALRPGCRAGVQLLLGAEIEPVLLSGDSLRTTQAIAHALGIEHIRGEVPLLDRRRALEGLIESGATVAAMGTLPRDESALLGASVPVVLGTSRTSDSQRGLVVLSGEMTLGCYALATLKQLERQALLASCLGFALIAAGVIALESGLFFAWIAPLSGLAGVVLGRVLTRIGARGFASAPDYGRSEAGGQVEAR